MILTVEELRADLAAVVDKYFILQQDGLFEKTYKIFFGPYRFVCTASGKEEPERVLRAMTFYHDTFHTKDSEVR